ncbi:MAG: hypothetical protein WBD10_05950 [Acidobacteriaceae bacterium]
MSNLTCASELTLHGLRVVALENDLLRVVALPEAGAKIWQITFKPLDADLLWNNPSLPPSRQPLHASYDDTWSGGWDELFPNDESGHLQGLDLPDHGELWTGVWDAKPLQLGDAAGVHLCYTTPLSQFLAEKTIILRPQSAVVEIAYRLTNLGAGTRPFLLKLHPAFAVSPRHRIDFPAMTVVREAEFEGTLAGAPPVFPWPYVSLGETELDLRQVPDPSSRALHFFYGTELSAGWCGVTNQENRLAAALRFDPEVFSCCWLFATHGGWRDLNVAVLEPATGYPLRIQSMIDEGRALSLAPGETLETKVLFSVQEGLDSIGGITESGRILPGDMSPGVDA